MMLVRRTFQLSSVCERWERITEQAGANGRFSPSRELCPWVTFLFVPAQSVVTTHRAHFLHLVLSRSLTGLSLQRCPFLEHLPTPAGPCPFPSRCREDGRLTSNSERCSPLASQEEKSKLKLPWLLPPWSHPRYPTGKASFVSVQPVPCPEGPMLDPAVTIFKVSTIF